MCLLKADINVTTREGKGWFSVRWAYTRQKSYQQKELERAGLEANDSSCLLSPHRMALTFRSIFCFFVQKYSPSICPHPPSKSCSFTLNSPPWQPVSRVAQRLKSCLAVTPSHWEHRCGVYHWHHSDTVLPTPSQCFSSDFHSDHRDY